MADAEGLGPARPVPSLADVLVESALLHATRAAIFRDENFVRPRLLPRPGAVVRRVLHGPASHRVRFAGLMVRRTARALRDEGVGGTLALVRGRLGGAPSAAAVSEGGGANPTAAALPEPASARLERRVLIVAELSIPQCAKYRVWQRREQIERLGVGCTVVDWRLAVEARSALQVHTDLILYRVPGEAANLALLAQARRLGVPSFWEVDDLVFDVGLYGENANLQSLPPKMQAELLRGAALYRVAMLAADRTIASTATLAALMTQASGRPSLVVENALDAETIGAGDRAYARAARARRTDGAVVIAYGSGTSTHDADFAVAAPAIRRLMREDARVRLCLVGELELDTGFEALADRIERVPFTGFKAYLALLAAADIAIAPLERTIFNDAKSNIKLIEAAIVGLPAVCSPAREFAGAIADGVDGFLAIDEAAWIAALRRLVADPALRREMGARAMARVRTAYDPARIAAARTAPLLAGAAPLRRRALRVLVVNVFFAPRSFGGATIVAEEMTRRLGARDDTEVFVFTTDARDGAVPHELVRYRACGAEVIAARMPFHADHILAFDDPVMGERFADVLRAVAPDVVHFHAMQNLGAALTRACQLRAIPYVVTLHDAWWLCERQFMVRADNVYCHQTAIDLKVCERCIPGARHLGPRMDILQQSLHAAALLLSPSASHAALYLANGFAPGHVRVNRNGVRRPTAGRTRRPAGDLRFGFVGGNAKLKGAAVIREAFRTIARRDWTLVVVDNTRDLGFSSVAAAQWRLPGRVEIVPPYDADGIDAFFADIDVLLFPSQWKESYGLTVREALLRDVWVIATDSGGAAEDVVEGVNGTIVALGNDPAPLAAAIGAALARRDAIRAHVNPFKAEIATLEAQTGELHAFLAEAARTRVGSVGAGVDAAAEQEQQHDDDQQEHTQAAAAPAADHGGATHAAAAAVPAASVTGVAEAAQRGHDQDNEQNGDHSNLRDVCP